MCGRFTLRTPAHRLAEAFGVEVLPKPFGESPVNQTVARSRVAALNDRLGQSVAAAACAAQAGASVPARADLIFMLNQCVTRARRGIAGARAGCAPADRDGGHIQSRDRLR